MRTQVMLERAMGLPWLEHDPAEGGPPQRIDIESFPFTIGRNESADFQVNSGRVSREHAAIVRDGTAYRVQDLHSTNGTFLNGRRIDEALLHDGDMLVLADVELTFCCGQSGSPQTTCTQVMEFGEAGAGGEDSDLPLAILRGVRRLHETLVHRSVAVLAQPVVLLESGEAMGYEAVSEGAGLDLYQPDEERLLLAMECRLTARIRQLRRMVAADEAAGFPGDASIFLKLDASEIGSQGLVESLEGLRNNLAGRRLVIEIPDSAVSDVPYARQLRRRLQELEIGLAYDGFASFAAGQMQHLQEVELRPDYLKLAPSLVRGIQHNRERQRQVQAVAETSREMGCELIAAGIEKDDEAETCRGLGCPLGQGDLFGRPQAVHPLVCASSVK